MLSRRHFFKNLAVLSVGTPLMMSSVQSMAASLSSDVSGDYKAIVFLNLSGGNDSSNMIVPTSAKHYNAYQNLRQSLALPLDQLLPIANKGRDHQGATVNFGLHPAMTALSEVFAQQRGSLITNCGILTEPVTKAQLALDPTKYPPQLYSHNSQTAEWFKGAVNESIKTGWAGRLMDALVLNGGNIDPLFSCSEDTQLLRAKGMLQNIIKGDDIARLGDTEAMKQSLDALVTLKGKTEGKIIFEKTVLDNTHDACTIAEKLFSLVSDQSFGTGNGIEADDAAIYPDSNLGTQFKVISRLVRQQKTLGQTRQLFFAQLGGFDTHIDQLRNQQSLFTQVSDSVAAFDKHMQAIGYHDKVLVMISSEFGRRLPSNGAGSDHGWGGHQMIIGSALQSQQAIGTWPDLSSVESENMVNNGRLLPSTGTDQVFGLLARWMGASEQDMATILPNEHKFPRLSLA